MRWTTWAKLLALYVLVAVAVPFVGYSLPPCFGNAEGVISPACMIPWEAAMPLFPERFVYVLGAPMSGVVTFLALTGATLVVDLARRFRARRSSDLHSRAARFRCHNRAGRHRPS